MDYRLVYAEKALTDLEEIVRYIAQDDELAASRFGSSMLSHVELLTRFPRMGGVVRKRPSVRKLVHSPFLIYYQVRNAEHEIEILHIRHGARKPPRSELRPKRD